jgi:hypothetical protein
MSRNRPGELMRTCVSSRGARASAILILLAASLTCAAIRGPGVGAALAAPRPSPAPAASPPAAAPAPAAAGRAPVRGFINGIPDTGQFLPDSAMLATVNEYQVTARKFIVSYFNAYAPDRPGQDSLGRVSFLQTMVDKEVLGRTARAAGYQLTYEERLVMREHTERVMASTLYQRAVADSAQPTEAEIRRAYEQYKYEVHLRHILFADKATAERARIELVSGRTPWTVAVKKYTRATADRGPDGDLGWVARINLSYPLALGIYDLKPREISAVIEDEDGPQLVQCVERREVTPLSYGSVRNTIADQVREYRTSELAHRIQNQLAAQIGFVVDSANVAWACKFFPQPMQSVQDPHGTNITIDASVPEFASTDTSRVLARWNGGQISIGGYMQAMSDVPPILRPNSSTPEALAMQVANVVLEPYQARTAVQRGYDKDPVAVAQIESRREQILVERMYEDSVTSHVTVTPAERRRYYDQKRAGFVTYDSRRFATIVRRSQAGADSVVAELRAGRAAQSVIAADSARGLQSGAIRDMLESEHGSPFRKLVFEELKIGQVTTTGPDRVGSFVVVQLISETPPRQLSFEESQGMADENLRNMKSEAELQKLLGRLRRRFKIVQHPELVMKIRLVDPSL